MSETFNCPKCAAPLDYDGGADLTIICPYCKNSVIVPETLRVNVSAPDAFDLTQLAGQSVRLKEMARLIRAGKKIEGIKIYREVFGVGLKEAKEAVEALERGTPVQVGATVVTTSAVTLPNAPKKNNRTLGCILAIIGLLFFGPMFVPLFFVPGSIIVALNPFAPTPTRTLTPTRTATTTPAPTATRIPSPTPTPAFMNLALKFGSSGSGPGMFTDARNITLDPEGNIFVADYTGGRVQKFDATGKFISVGLVEGKLPVFALASDRRGRVNVAQGGAIFRFDSATFKALGPVEYTGGNRFGHIATTPDGGILAMWYEQREGLITSIQGHREDLVRFDADGKVTQVWRGPISSLSGFAELDARIAVDGQGNLFVLASNAEHVVFAFSSDGKFINRFGSRGNSSGQLASPRAIAVDNQGRVHVADARGVNVFAPDGRYIEMYPVDNGVSAMTFDDKNNLWVVARTQVLKYVMK